MCIALPEHGREALRTVDPDAHFTTAAPAPGRAHLREHLTSDRRPRRRPRAGPADGELMLRAAGEPADAEALEPPGPPAGEEPARARHRHRLGEGRPEVSVLAAERQRLQQRIDSVMAER